MAKIARTLVFTDDQLDDALDNWYPNIDPKNLDTARGLVIDFLHSGSAHKLYVMSTHPMNDPGRGD